jgi:hypothetical protein
VRLGPTFCCRTSRSKRRRHVRENIDLDGHPRGPRQLGSPRHRQSWSDGGRAARHTPERFASRLTQQFREALSDIPSRPRVVMGAGAQLTTPSPEDQAQLARLRTYPADQEGRALLNVLKTLSPLAVSLLRGYGDDQVRSLESGARAGLKGSPQKSCSERN